MSQDVTQWLSEIQSLQQQLAQVQQDREAAQSSAQHWRDLYNTEAQQRRTEARLARQNTDRLQALIDRLEREQSPQLEGEALSVLQRELDRLSIDELKQRAIEIRQERDRLREQVTQLTRALEEEKANHAKTREDLTTALGDTVELLAKARGEKLPEQRKSEPDESEDTPLEDAPDQQSLPSLEHLRLPSFSPPPPSAGED